MSANVVDGLSAWYALALLRPIDITLPIWPCARRWSQTKKPMISRIGRSRLRMPRNQLLLGWVKLKSGTFSRISASSVSDGPAAWPVVLNRSPESSSPVMLPVSFSHSACTTSPAATSAMNSEYETSSPLSPDVNAGTSTTARNRPTAIQGSQRLTHGGVEPRSSSSPPDVGRRSGRSGR